MTQIITPSDSRADIQAKLNLAAGGVATFEPGTYVIDAPLSVPSATLVDLGRAVLTIPDDHPDLPIFALQGVDTVDIAGGVLDGNVGGQSVWSQYKHAITIKSCSGVKVRDMRLRNLCGDGIYVSRTLPSGAWSSLITIDRCWFSGGGLNRNGVSIIAANGVKISGCDFSNMGRAGMPGAIDLEPNSDADLIRNVSITGCVIGAASTSEAARGVQITTSHGGQILGVVVSGCVVYGGMTDLILASAKALDDIEGLVISGCYLDGYGQASDGVELIATKAVVDGCSIDNVTGTPLKLSSGAVKAGTNLIRGVPT